MLAETARIDGPKRKRNQLAHCIVGIANAPVRLLKVADDDAVAGSAQRSFEQSAGQCEHPGGIPRNRSYEVAAFIDLNRKRVREEDAEWEVVVELGPKRVDVRRGLGPPFVCEGLDGGIAADQAQIDDHQIGRNSAPPRLKKASLLHRSVGFKLWKIHCFDDFGVVDIVGSSQFLNRVFKRMRTTRDTLAQNRCAIGGEQVIRAYAVTVLGHGIADAPSAIPGGDACMCEHAIAQLLRPLSDDVEPVQIQSSSRFPAPSSVTGQTCEFCREPSL